MTSPLLIFALGVTTNRGGGLIRAGRPAPVASRSRSSRMSEAEEKAVGKLEQELSAAVAAEDYSQVCTVPYNCGCPYHNCRLCCRRRRCEIGLPRCRWTASTAR